MPNAKFVRFIGPFWNGRGVAVYSDGNEIQLCAETCGGKFLPVPAHTVSVARFEQLEGAWASGLVSPRDDVRMTRRALQHLSAE